MAAHILALYNAPNDPEAFEQYYHGTHIPLAKRLPGLRSYSVSKGPLSTPAGTAPYYVVADLLFDSMDAIASAFASDEGKATVADIPNFAGNGATVMMYESNDV